MKTQEIIDKYFKDTQEWHELSETEAKELFDLIEKGKK